MRSLRPFGLMLVGLVLLIAGFAVPFLMIIQVLQPSFLGAFLSYMASLGGLIIGVIGTAIYARERQN
jgi:hypothetical protein